MNAKLTIVKMTPAWAAKLLGNLYDGQRNLKPAYVLRLASEMKAGSWRLAPDCLLTVKDKLFNGQHRLSAVVQSGVTVQFILMESNDDELYKVIDGGKSRTVADVIHLHNGETIAAVARWIIRYDLDLLNPRQDGGADQTGEATRSLSIEFIEQHREPLQEAVIFCRHLYSQCHLISPTITAAVLFIASRDRKEPALTKQFLQNVYDGESKDDAARDLRERLVRSKMGSSRLPRNMVFALILKSLRSYLNGTRLGVLRINEAEAFPKL